jgi:hypothetical protein
MLTRRAASGPTRLRRALLSIAVGLGVMLAGGFAVALADPGGGECPPNATECDVWGGGGSTRPPGGGEPGDPGDPGGGGGGPCMRDGVEVPCYSDLLGWFNPSDGCYYKVAEPQPAGGPPGQTQYLQSCGGGPLPIQVPVWLADPPAGAVPPPDPFELAMDALASINLMPPGIGIAPDPARGPGLVGLPVWLWVKEEPSSWDPDKMGYWGPLTASASDRGVTVTITATVEKIVWRMGDGTEITCATRGTAFIPAVHKGTTPPCGFAGYTKPSDGQPGGRYGIRATTTWRVPWSGGGESGVITGETRTSTAAIEIDELQVVTR